MKKILFLANYKRKDEIESFINRIEERLGARSQKIEFTFIDYDNSVEAIVLIKVLRPNLLFLDHNLSSREKARNGLDVAKWMRFKRQNVLIFSIATELNQSLLEAYKDCATPHLPLSDPDAIFELLVKLTEEKAQ